MMLNDFDELDNDPVAPECRPTVERIQRALDGDGELPTADGHAEACAACRERVRAARVLLSALEALSDPVVPPAGFADRVMLAAWAERRAPARRSASRLAALLALAAAVLVGVWFIAKPAPKDDTVANPQPAPVEMAQRPPEPNPQPEPPVRVSDAIASTEQAIREAPKPLADSVAVAPKLFDAVTGSFKLPESKADPMGQALEPARKSLDALPVAARAGLEPVTGTAEKAFNRFLRDVGSVKPNS